MAIPIHTPRGLVYFHIVEDRVFGIEREEYVVAGHRQVGNAKVPICAKTPGPHYGDSVLPIKKVVDNHGFYHYELMV